VDPCHLTAAGGRKFVDVLKPIIEQAIDDWEQGLPKADLPLRVPPDRTGR
jgi:hypothetical protein